MKNAYGIPPPNPKEETPQGATLSEKEIIEKVERGEIKLKDMKIHEREKYKQIAPVWKQ